MKPNKKEYYKWEDVELYLLEKFLQKDITSFRNIFYDPTIYPSLWELTEEGLDWVKRNRCNKDAEIYEYLLNNLEKGIEIRGD